MPTFHSKNADDWNYWTTAPAPHAARSFPSLTDAIRPDHAEPEHLDDIAATAALTGGRLAETWQFGDAPDKDATARRIRTWRTLWRLGVVRPDTRQGVGAMRFILADWQTIARDAEQMTPETTDASPSAGPWNAEPSRTPPPADPFSCHPIGLYLGYPSFAPWARRLPQLRRALFFAPQGAGPSRLDRPPQTRHPRKPPENGPPRPAQGPPLYLPTGHPLGDSNGAPGRGPDNG
jgi:hypothetical protein